MNDIQALREKVKNLKVLFIDDEEDIRDGTGIFLRKFFDNVVVCSDGAEGLKVFYENNNFDVVITDVMMPVMDGMEMVKEIRKTDPDFFVIFLTAAIEMEGFDKNIGNITLQKPLSFDSMTFIMEQLGATKW